MIEEFKITFEWDYAIHTKYRVTITNGKVTFEDDVSSKHMPMSGLLVINTGQVNGTYSTKKETEEQLLQFVFDSVKNWQCYYPKEILDHNDKWKLKVEFNEIEFCSAGDGSKPDEFEKLVDLINLLLATSDAKEKVEIETHWNEDDGEYDI